MTDHVTICINDKPETGQTSPVSLPATVIQGNMSSSSTVFLENSASDHDDNLQSKILFVIVLVFLICSLPRTILNLVSLLLRMTKWCHPIRFSSLQIYESPFNRNDIEETVKTNNRNYFFYVGTRSGVQLFDHFLWPVFQSPMFTHYILQFLRD